MPINVSRAYKCFTCFINVSHVLTFINIHYKCFTCTNIYKHALIFLSLVPRKSPVPGESLVLGISIYSQYSPTVTRTEMSAIKSTNNIILVPLGFSSKVFASLHGTSTLGSRKAYSRTFPTRCRCGRREQERFSCAKTPRTLFLVLKLPVFVPLFPPIDSPGILPGSSLFAGILPGEKYSSLVRFFGFFVGFSIALPTFRNSRHEFFSEFFVFFKRNYFSANFFQRRGERDRRDGSPNRDILF